MQLLSKQNEELAAKNKSLENELATGKASAALLEEHVVSLEAKKSALESSERQAEKNKAKFQELRDEVSSLRAAEAQHQKELGSLKEERNALELNLQALQQETNRSRVRIGLVVN